MTKFNNTSSTTTYLENNGELEEVKDRPGLFSYNGHRADVSTRVVKEVKASVVIKRSIENEKRGEESED